MHLIDEEKDTSDRDPTRHSSCGAVHGNKGRRPAASWRGPTQRRAGSLAALPTKRCEMTVGCAAVGIPVDAKGMDVAPRCLRQRDP